MATENLGQILLDAGVISDIPALRSLLASGKVAQGGTPLFDRNMKIDTANGILEIEGWGVIDSWINHSLN